MLLALHNNVSRPASGANCGVEAVIELPATVPKSITEHDLASTRNCFGAMHFGGDRRRVIAAVDQGLCGESRNHYNGLSKTTRFCIVVRPRRHAERETNCKGG